MPLPNDSLFHPDWSALHRPTADGQMTAVGTITVPASGPGTFDETTGRSTPAAGTVIYGPGVGTGYRDGRMRVQRMLQGGTAATALEVGNREVILRQYRVSIPVDGPTQPIPIGAVVELEVCDDDPTAIGRALHVRGVQVGSLVWQRDLFCEDTGPTTR